MGLLTPTMEEPTDEDATKLIAALSKLADGALTMAAQARAETMVLRLALAHLLARFAEKTDNPELVLEQILELQVASADAAEDKLTPSKMTDAAVTMAHQLAVEARGTLARVQQDRLGRRQPRHL